MTAEHALMELITPYLLPGPALTEFNNSVSAFRHCTHGVIELREYTNICTHGVDGLRECSQARH